MKSRSAIHHLLGIGLLLFLTLACQFLTPETVLTPTPLPPPTRQLPTNPPSPQPASQPVATTTPSPQEQIEQKSAIMRFIPAGEIEMGFNPSNMENYERASFLFDARPEYRPAHQVSVEAFYLDQFEVSNEQYRACEFASGCITPKTTSIRNVGNYYGNREYRNYPVVGVTWQMAKAFCEWRGARLPTEAEWERAAKGMENSVYPWDGSTQSCQIANYYNCAKRPVAVDSYPNGVSGFGIYNLAGNVAEWTSSLYWPYPYDDTDGREDLYVNGERTVRGGSWESHGGNVDIYTFARYGYYALKSNYNDYTGFRCAKSLEP